jgi:hypothetical protein
MDKEIYLIINKIPSITKISVKGTLMSQKVQTFNLLVAIKSIHATSADHDQPAHPCHHDLYSSLLSQYFKFFENFTKTNELFKRFSVVRINLSITHRK